MKRRSREEQRAPLGHPSSVGRSAGEAGSRPRPVQSEGFAAAPAQLLDAALRVFAENGYRATRLEAVAAAAGMTKGAIYYYFESKEDLLRQAVRSRHERIFHELTEALAEQPGQPPLATRIRLVLRKVWRHWLDPATGAAVRLMVGEVSVELPALFQTWAEVGPVRGWEVVRDLLEEGKRRGEFRADVDAEVAARLVISGLMMQALLHVHLGIASVAPCDPDRLFDSSMDTFLRGVTVPLERPQRSASRRTGRAGADH